jgi:DNA polymerase III sliding clamp (beta) subunit (PCNA family)
VLRGVHVADGWAVATDSYRITRASLSISGLLGTIPVSLAREWSRHAASGDVFGGGSAVVLESDRTTWHGLLLPGDFPDVTSHFKEPAWALGVERAELRDALRRVAVVGPRDSRVVHVDPGRNGVVLWSEEPQVGRVEAPLAVAGDLDHALCLHAAYLAQAVDGHPEEDMSLQISGGPGLAPVVISGSVVEHLVAQQRFTE